MRPGYGYTSPYATPPSPLSGPTSPGLRSGSGSALFASTSRGLYSRSPLGSYHQHHGGSPLKDRPTRSTSPFDRTYPSAAATTSYLYGERPGAPVRERPGGLSDRPGLSERLAERPGLGSGMTENPYSLSSSSFKSTFQRSSPYSTLSAYNTAVGAGYLNTTPTKQRVSSTTTSYTTTPLSQVRYSSPTSLTPNSSGRQRIRGTSFREEYSGGSPRTRMRRAPSMVSAPGTTMVPPQASEDYRKYSIVLDLDETLIYARDGPLYARPGVDELLEFLGKNAEAIAWTAGLRAYAQAVLHNIDKTHAVRHCIYRHAKWFTNEPGYQKDLSLLGRPLDRTLIIENTPDCIRANRENGILVADYEGGEVPDHTIPKLTEFLRGLVASGMSVPQYLAQCPHLTRRKVSTDRGDFIECYWLEVNNPPGSPGASPLTRYNRDLPSYSSY
ncbi:hypothetical protein DIPPA_15660 [Diplonema papillatum]|nr:hypothetical protein DIPPA_15660 [Diplonema papillatum]